MVWFRLCRGSGPNRVNPSRSNISKSVLPKSTFCIRVHAKWQTKSSFYQARIRFVRLKSHFAHLQQQLKDKTLSIQLLTDINLLATASVIRQTTALGLNNEPTRSPMTNTNYHWHHLARQSLNSKSLSPLTYKSIPFKSTPVWIFCQANAIDTPN